MTDVGRFFDRSWWGPPARLGPAAEQIPSDPAALHDRFVELTTGLPLADPRARAVRLRYLDSLLDEYNARLKP